MGVFAEIEKTDFLPAHLPVMQKALELLASDDVKISQVADLIITDQSLTAKFLRIVNSAAFGLNRRVVDVATAIVYLGLSETRSTVLAMSARSMMQGEALRDLWMHSLKVAYLTEALNMRARVRSDPSQAFLVGLLHDIGEVFLQSHFSFEWAQVTDQIRLGASPIEAEFRVFSLDHAIVGQTLLKKWNMPPAISEAVLYHHAPGESSDPLCWLLAFADEIDLSGGQLGDLDERLASLCPVTPSEIQTYYQAALKRITDLESRLASID